MHSVIKVLMIVVLLLGTMLVPKQNEVQAALPLAAWAASALGGVITDVAIDAGIEFLDNNSKNAWKDKKVGEIWNKYGDEIAKLKPTKKNAKQWALKVPKWLMATIVDEVGDTIEDTVTADTDRRTKNKAGHKSEILDSDSSDPFYNTGITVGFAVNDYSSATRKFSAYLKEWTDIYIRPKAYEQSSEVFVCPAGVSDYSECGFYEVDGGETVYLTSTYSSGIIAVDASSITITSGSTDFKYKNQYSVYIDSSSGIYLKSYNAFLKYLELLETKNMTVYYSDGVIATKGSNSYFDLPDTIYDGDESKQVVYSKETLEELDENKYPMIKEREFVFDFGDDTDIIDAEWTEVQEGDEVEWAVIERDIETNVSNYNKTYNYDYEPTINNYYTVADPEEIKNDVEVIIKNEIVVNDGDNTINGGATGKIDVDIEGPFYCVDKSTKQITSCKEVEAIDGGLLDYISNAYDYAVNAVKSAVDGLNTIVAGSASLLTLYGEIFDWLPKEMTVILTSGLLLMIGLRVFRK